MTTIVVDVTLRAPTKGEWEKYVRETDVTDGKDVAEVGDVATVTSAECREGR